MFFLILKRIPSVSKSKSGLYASGIGQQRARLLPTVGISVIQDPGDLAMARVVLARLHALRAMLAH